MWVSLCHCVACNVWYLGSVELESLTGHQAVQKATTLTLSMDPPPASTVVHFKVSAQGITLTDNQRKWVSVHLWSKRTQTQIQVRSHRNPHVHTDSVWSRRLFFRRHYAVNTVIFCSLDPQGRKWVLWLYLHKLHNWIILIHIIITQISSLNNSLSWWYTDFPSCKKHPLFTFRIEPVVHC